MNGDTHTVVIEPGNLDPKGEKVIQVVVSDAEASNGKDPEETEKFILNEAEARSQAEIYPHGSCSRWVERVENDLKQVYKRHQHAISVGFKVLLFLLYIAYFGYCVYQRYFDEGAYVLTVITAFLVLRMLYSRLCSSKFNKVFAKFLVWYGATTGAHRMRKYFRYGLYLAASVCLLVYLGINVISNYNPSNGQAVMGIFVIICMCYVTSYRPSRVNWHPVFWGFVIQFAFATLTLRTTAGYNAFKWVGDIIYNLVRLSDKGSTFVLGSSFLAENAGFFFDCTGVMVFFNACIFLMEYYGVLEFMVLKIGRCLAVCLETGPVESVVAAANIFIGLSEAPLLVRPYLPTVTKSELHAIMTCGFSSISGAFMAMFIKVGAPASHLLTAAVISAPAALAITKLMYPEVEEVNYVSQRNIKMRDENNKNRNALQAFSDGALFSIKLVAAIMVNMLAFVSMLSLLDAILMWLGQRANIEGMSFQWLCSFMFYPLSYLMGTHPDDCGAVGSLIGLKLMATPFVAYADLGKMIQNRHVLEEYTATTNGSWHWAGRDIILDDYNTTLSLGVMRERSEVITTYALCGISAFPAIGFTMGTLIPMAPERKNDIVNVVVRSFIAGNLANIITGSVAGVMYSGT
uniref:Sodium/nucleoside cotransporter n=1 Tax=Arion vulgaris TaxID=1028688 RepID=A0A0B7BBT3_9EUPU